MYVWFGEVSVFFFDLQTHLIQMQLLYNGSPPRQGDL